MKTHCKMVVAIGVAVITLGSVYGITEISHIDALRDHAGYVNGEQVSLLGYYSDTPGVGGGVFYRKTPDIGEILNDNGGTIVKVTNQNIYWIRAQKNYLRVEDFGARANNDDLYAVSNKTAFQASLRCASDCGGGTVNVNGMLGAYVLPECTGFYELSNVALRGNKTTLKLLAGAETYSWLIIKHAGGIDGGGGTFAVSGFILDGNGIACPDFNCDHALMVIDHSLGGVNISDMTVKNSAAKGLAVTCGTDLNGGTGGSVNVRFDKITAYSCKTQAVMTDSTGTGPCKKITLSNIIVKDTQHAGIAINDGSEMVSLANSIADVNNTAWDAISVRGSKDVSITNCIGSRGRSGLRLSALATDDECKNITGSGNLWDSNIQSGVLIIGTENVSISGDISKNNQCGWDGFGITQAVGIKRANNVTLSSIQAFDDRATILQSHGIRTMAADNVLISSPLCHENVLKNISYLATDTKIYVANDGRDGVTRKVKSINVTVPGGGNCSIDIPWDSAFIDSNFMFSGAAIVEGSAGKSLRLHHFSGLNTNISRAVIINDDIQQRQGILHIYAERN